LLDLITIQRFEADHFRWPENVGVGIFAEYSAKTRAERKLRIADEQIHRADTFDFGLELFPRALSRMFLTESYWTMKSIMDDR
jgi:hypothetical protein